MYLGRYSGLEVAGTICDSLTREIRTLCLAKKRPHGYPLTCTLEGKNTQYCICCTLDSGIRYGDTDLLIKLYLEYSNEAMLHNQ